MVTMSIESRVGVSRRYVRATEMVRDLDDPAALDGYVVTASVREATRRIVAGLDPSSGQRAFRVTGPYGSGKSSFGLFLARLLRGDGAAVRLAREHAGIRQVPSYRPLVVTGRRASFTRDLLAAIERTASEGSFAVPLELVAASRAASPPDPSLALDALDALASAVPEGGLALLVDEMGRYLEHAAAHPRDEDPSVFQQLAERAGGRGQAPLAVVAFLHHRFADYVAGFGEWIQSEWAKSAERYEEVAFSESAEQTLFLLAHALDPRPAHARPVASAAAALYSEAGERGLFATAPKELASLSKRLYPLHPATVATLSAVSRRFGQNERSVFGFLQSLEPHGFRRFAAERTYSPEDWYRPSELFDYLRAQGDLRLRSADRERRWQLALDAVADGEGMPELQLATLKTVALLASVEPVGGLRTDVHTLAWCVDAEDEDCRQALDALVARRLLYRRPGTGEHRLWSNSSVDLERWLEDAAIAIPEVTRIDRSLASRQPPRPIVAHRHYHRTGTLRTFFFEGAGTAAGDGRIVLVPVHPDEDRDDAMAATIAASTEADGLTVHCLRRIEAADLRWARELLMWRWIGENCDELRVDGLARTEVAVRTAAAEAAVSRALAPPTISAAGRSDVIWVNGGAVLEIGRDDTLSGRLSDICDAAFPDAPILRNELVNRSRLSTAVASARMRLLELMVSRGGEEDLGLSGAPPERTIYLAMLRASGMHRRRPDGSYVFGAPEEDLLNWRPAWDHLGQLVGRHGLVGLDALMEELSRPPFGLRNGPALVLIAAFMLANRHEVALMERGSFQPELTGAHFMRMAKSPAKFALRHLGDDEDRSVLLRMLRTRVAVLDRAEHGGSTLRDVVETLYGWWGRLAPFALATAGVDAATAEVRAVIRKAREPVELVFVDLPRACGVLSPDGAVDAELYAERLDAALTQLDETSPLLRALAAASLSDAFGARDLDGVHAQISTDYAPHRFQLRDFHLRQFVERMLAPEGADRRLDGVAGLLAGRRLDGWDDGSLDLFSFEARAIADRLARWLATVRRAVAGSVEIRTVHVVSSAGDERVMVVRPPTDGERVIEARVRELLGDDARGAAILSRVLADIVPAIERDEERT